MTFHQFASLAIFLIVFALILAGENSPGKLDRPSAGLLGGVLMVLAGVMSRQQALAAIDFSTIILLLGMMIVVHFASESGLIDGAAHRMIDQCKSRGALVWGVCFAAGILSALFVNDTICLMMTPMLLAVAMRARMQAEPLLIALATSSNVGSVMTLTGNPQNMLIGQSSHWGWGAYALRMIPIGLICLAVNAAIVQRVYRSQLGGIMKYAGDGVESKTQTLRPIDRKLAAKTLVVAAGLVIALCVGAPMDMAALVAATTLLVFANRKPEDAFLAVDWSLLIFFAGLFVVVHGFVMTNGALLSRIAPALIDNAGTSMGLARFSLCSVVGSNLFSNVPFVMLLRPLIGNAPTASLIWISLAATSTLAGNLTLLGSVANLIVAQGAKDQAPLSFVAFLRVGIPTTLATVAIAVALIAVLHRIGLA